MCTLYTDSRKAKIHISQLKIKRLFAPDHWFPNWWDRPSFSHSKHLFFVLEFHASLDWTDPWNRLYFQINSIFWQIQLCPWFRGYRVRIQPSLKVPYIWLTETESSIRNLSIRKPFLYLQAEAMPFFKTSRVTITWKIELPIKITPYIGGVG